MRFTILLLTAASFAADSVQFKTHVIESKIPGGYALLIADINKDGKPDVIGITSRLTELAWYENPGWQRHVMVQGMNGLVNMAAHDVDGDGYPEVAVENEFSMVAAKSPGHVWLLKHDGDPTKLWKKIKLDALITSHHAAWADIDGDGKKELINAPLIGPNALAPKYEDHVPLVYYHVPKNLESDWKREIIDEKIYGVLHRARPVKWTGGKRDQILTASFDGIALHESTGKGDKIKWTKTVLSKGHEEPAPRAGTSDVAVGRIGKHRILAAVEPWHGNEVVVYTPGKSGAWNRKVIFSELTEGHEVCVGDFNGDGRDDIVAGDRARGQISSSHLFYSLDEAGSQWKHEVLDEKGMSASGCAVTDMNGDKRLDIIMIGGATTNIKFYENLGPQTR